MKGAEQGRIRILLRASKADQSKRAPAEVEDGPKNCRDSELVIADATGVIGFGVATLARHYEEASGALLMLLCVFVFFFFCAALECGPFAMNTGEVLHMLIVLLCGVLFINK